MNFVDLNEQELYIMDGGINWTQIGEGLVLLGGGIAIVASAEVTVPALIGGYIASAAAGYFVGSGISQ